MATAYAVGSSSRGGQRGEDRKSSGVRMGCILTVSMHGDRGPAGGYGVRCEQHGTERVRTCVHMGCMSQVSGVGSVCVVRICIRAGQWVAVRSSSRIRIDYLRTVSVHEDRGAYQGLQR